MASYLLTGLAGTGKTTVLKELARRSIATVDADFDPAITGWISKETGRLVVPWSAGQTTAPEGSTWGWDRHKVTELAANPPGNPFFFGGNTAGMEVFYPLFDRVFALTADDETIRTRLTSPRDNPHGYGKKPEHIAETLAANQYFARQEAGRGAVLIDATLPVASIADQILRHCHEA